MKSILSTLLIVSTLTLSAQTETSDNDSLRSLQIMNNELGNKVLKQPENLQSNFIGEMNKEELLNSVASEKPTQGAMKTDEIQYKSLQFTMPEIYVGPSTQLSYSSFAFANDYSFYNNIPIADKVWLSTVSRHETMPIIGAERTVAANLNYMPANWIVFSGGPFVSKYNSFMNHGNNFGVNGRMKIFLHDRIRLNGFGQYAAYGQGDTYGPGMMQQTYFGGSMEFRITKHFGVEGGVIRELNPITGKWQNRTFISPVFYGGN